MVYRLRKLASDGRTEAILTPRELLDRPWKLRTPPRRGRPCRCCARAAVLQCKSSPSSRTHRSRTVLQNILLHIGEPTQAPIDPTAAEPET